MPAKLRAISFRTTGTLYDRLERESAQSGRSLTQEINSRLMDSFKWKPVVSRLETTVERLASTSDSLIAIMRWEQDQVDKLKINSSDVETMRRLVQDSNWSAVLKHCVVNRMTLETFLRNAVNAEMKRAGSKWRLSPSTEN